MSEENVEIVRRGCGAMREYLRDPSGDLAPYLVEWLDPEIEWRGPREFPDLAEPHRGHEGVRRYVGTIRDGRAIRMESYWKRSDALKAAGLSV